MELSITSQCSYGQHATYTDNDRTNTTRLYADEVNYLGVLLRAVMATNTNMIIYSQVKAGAEGPISQPGKWWTLRQCTSHPQERESHINLSQQETLWSSPPLPAHTKSLRATLNYHTQDSSGGTPRFNLPHRRHFESSSLSGGTKRYPRPHQGLRSHISGGAPPGLIYHTQDTRSSPPLGGIHSRAWEQRPSKNTQNHTHLKRTHLIRRKIQYKTVSHRDSSPSSEADLPRRRSSGRTISAD